MSIVSEGISIVGKERFLLGGDYRVLVLLSDLLDAV